MKKLKINKKKASRAVNNTANFTKENWKPLLIVVGVGVAGYLIYRTTKKVVNQVDDIFPDFGNDPNAGGGNLNTNGGNTPIETSSGTTSISPNQAQAIAAGLLQAMNGFGTDEQRIYQLLAGKSLAEFALISQAFGEPRYDGAGEAMWPAPKRNLTYWLNSELSQSEFNKLKQLMPGVF